MNTMVALPIVAATPTTAPAMPGASQPHDMNGPETIAARYETLLGQYIHAHVKWSGAASSSFDYDHANEIMCEIGDEMGRLEDEIDSLPTSVWAFRATVLKELRYSLPAFHDESNLSDGNGGDLTLLWSALRFTGLDGLAHDAERKIRVAIEDRLVAA